ncbi:hypothetical protein [Herbaspirillum sp.]|uniref:hypothetical protein n=1 Tax=Herbaspirillum sp. TaxID=1890675 RepID=UPI001AFE7F59|nr:hypothetical protein [Herbaspirillum sp.]MBO9535406.1 hypothetical protein [Herbaspirillum sp.]
MSAAKLVKEIPLDKAVSGMVLAQPIEEKPGTYLMPAGTKLSEKSLHTLKNRGVLHVTVVLSPADDMRGQAEMQVDEQLKRVDVLFRNSRHSDANRVLMNCLRRYRTKGRHDSPD